MVAGDPKGGSEMPSALIFFQVLFIPLGLVAMLGGLEGASLYPRVITFLVAVNFASGRRWVGEPVTAHESVGLLGTKLDRLTFDDNNEAR